MQRALVTGAGARLGRAMALYLAGRGHDVAVHYATSADGAQAVVDEIRGMGRTAVALQADLLDEDAVQALVPAAMEGLGGPITCLVNNASVFEFDDVASATRASWDRHMMSNLRAPFVLLQHVARHVPEAQPDDTGEPVAQGLCVNMLDQKLRALTPEHMTYTIAKMGLWAMTRLAAQDLGDRMRVNGIGPGPTLQGARQSKENFDKQRRTTVLGRGSNPRDITAALGFFLDSPAVTGQLLCVDGGQHLAWGGDGHHGA